MHVPTIPDDQPTVGSSVPGPREAPDLFAVRPRRGPEPALLVAGLAVALVAIALWKPWTPAARLDVASADIASPSSRPSPEPSRELLLADQLDSSTSIPPVDGLDLSIIGTQSERHAWGVAAAYVARSSLVEAVLRNAPTLAPIGDWAPMPALSRETVLNARDTVTVAVAVTWPADERPRSVALVRLATPGSIQGGSGRGRPAAEMALNEPLPNLVRLTPGRLAHSNPLDRVSWQLLSGTYFLPPGDAPRNPEGWLSRGWAIGSYEFDVTLADGTVIRLPFRIGA